MAVRRILDSVKVFRLIKYFALVAFLSLLVRNLNSSEMHDAYVEVLRSFQDDKKLFLQDFMAHDFESRLPDHGFQVAKLCANRTWFPEDKGVILSCDPLPGGMGTVKNGQLNCIRFAIEAGAQLLLPRMHPRSEADVTNLYGAKNSKGLSMDYMFSIEHLVGSLGAICPQLRIHGSLDDLYDTPSLLQPIELLSLSQVHDLEQFAVLNDTETTILKDPSRLRPTLLDLIEDKKPEPPAKEHWPIRVNLGNSLFNWPTLERGESLRREMGSLLRTRDDIRLLAGSALYNLAHKFDLPQLLRRDTGFTGVGTLPNFTGIHLRTEKDSWNFPDFAVQVEYFMDYLKSQRSYESFESSVPDESNKEASRGVPGGQPDGRKLIVYLATGLRAADADVQNLRARAAEYDITVVLKRDLFEGPELAILDQISYDQRALLDYEILLRVGHMLGVVESSFAWDVALKRAAIYGGRSGYKAFTPQPGENNGQLVMWHDRLSTLYGKSAGAVSQYYGTWP